MEVKQVFTTVENASIGDPERAYLDPMNAYDPMKLLSNQIVQWMWTRALWCGELVWRQCSWADAWLWAV
eukprot:scaffold4852_cov161-Skeletonema_marinoi.AAC.2